MKAVYSIKIQNFLEEHNCLPQFESCGVAYYKPTRLFFELLEKYEIHKAFKNYL